MNASQVSRTASGRAILCGALVAAALAAYANHFHNEFHFDDLRAIKKNPAVCDAQTIPRAFVDPKLFSSNPPQWTYRPVTLVSLAVDCRLGGGLDLFYFHLSTFLWFSVQLVLMFRLFEWLMNRADPHPSNTWTALVAAAVFGLHPACAETVNYVIQRADVYNTLGAVAGLWLYIRYPAGRRFGWYLWPVAAAILAKPPALVFPLILLLYVLLFEADGVSGNLRKWAGALRAILPALALAGAGGYLLARMQPKPAGNWADSPFLYRITQPFVALHYFKEFFLPTDLSIDAGWGSVRPLSLQAVAGYAFVLGMVGVALAASRTRRGRPVAFGILWFLAALLPTSLTPLADVTNDHRMFFPFVGLTLAVCWSLRLALFRQTAGLTANPGWVRGAAVAVMALLAVEGVGTWHRNQVWFTDESLWHDAILKNPRDSKAWTNYGIVFLAQGDYETALPSLQRAAALDPSNSAAQVGLVNALVQLHRNDEVAPHFQRLLDLNPPKPDAYIAYAEWLNALGRLAESGALLERAARLYPPTVELRQARLVYFLARDAAGRIAAIGALDANHDTILSAGELLNAPAVLRGLDRNGDGKLSAEECGAHFREAAKLDPESLRRARRQFMESQPVLRALDTNRDGEISAGEIDAADRELATLDANGDGQLEPEEYLPECVVAAARGILALLDPHHEGRIDGAQRRSAAAEGFRGLLDAADVDGDGTVTLTELTNEIFYRADLHKDGMVTAGELAEAARLGLLGTVPLAAAATLPAGTAGRPPR